MEAVPVPDGWADVVISNGVLSLTPDKQRALSAEFRAEADARPDPWFPRRRPSCTSRRSGTGRPPVRGRRGSAGPRRATVAGRRPNPVRSCGRGGRSFGRSALRRQRGSREHSSREASGIRSGTRATFPPGYWTSFLQTGWNRRSASCTLPEAHSIRTPRPASPRGKASTSISNRRRRSSSATR
jgi:hypothetical protein